jgi:hypothetical protein
MSWRGDPVRSRLVAKLVAPAALAAALAGVAPATAAAASPRCEDKVGDTLTRSSTTRVFQRVRGAIDDGQTVHIFACRLRSRKFVLVDHYRNDLDGELQIQDTILGGSRYVVFVDEELTGTSDSIDLFEYDLTVPGRRAFAFSRDGSREGAEVAVTTGGGIAFLDAGSVRVFDATGTRVLAASGASDLAAGGNTVYWTAAGAPVSTPLTGHPTSS